MNTLPDSDLPQTPENEPINKNYRHSGFWRRVVAYCIDTILLGMVGLVLGYLFYEHFLSIGQAGRWYGLVIYLGYFATLNSQIAGGQTLGKRMLGIKVVGSDAAPLAFSTALIRQSIIATPIFLNGLTIDIGLNQHFVSILQGIAIFGIGGAIAYFLVFNTQTRRSLHDFICASHVIKVEPGKSQVDTPRVWKGHFAVLGVAALLYIAGLVWLTSWSKNAYDMTKILALYEKLSLQDNIRQAGVHVSVSNSLINGESRSATYLQIVAFPPYPISSDSEYAMQVVGKAVEDESILPDSDLIVFAVITGFDLGIARQHTTKSVSDSPANWKRAIEHYKTQGTAPQVRFSSKTQVRF